MSKPVFENMFRFSGRRNRKSFILFELVRVLAFTIIGVPMLIALAAGDKTVTSIVAFLALVAALPLCWAGWAVFSQRCRDFGWTGWATLLLLLPYVGWVFPLAACFIPGTLGSNRYGPDPLESRLAPSPRREPRLDVGEIAA
jgi:uncharacterized membrane protein YhaH (DUF805 family)